MSRLFTMFDKSRSVKLFHQTARKVTGAAGIALITFSGCADHQVARLQQSACNRTLAVQPFQPKVSAATLNYLAMREQVNHQRLLDEAARLAEQTEENIWDLALSSPPGPADAIGLTPSKLNLPPRQIIETVYPDPPDSVAAAPVINPDFSASESADAVAILDALSNEAAVIRQTSGVPVQNATLVRLLLQPTPQSSDESEAAGDDAEAGEEILATPLPADFFDSLEKDEASENAEAEEDNTADDKQPEEPVFAPVKIADNEAKSKQTDEDSTTTKREESAPQKIAKREITGSRPGKSNATDTPALELSPHYAKPILFSLD